jgi:hypothetical protein
MLVHSKRHLVQGLLLLGSFSVIFILILSRIFPQGQNGLEYADELFNKLSKGSSYFIPAVSEQVQTVKGTNFDVEVKLKDSQRAETAVALLNRVGMTASAQEEVVRASGDLGAMLEQVLAASDAMYYNNSEKVSQAFGMEARMAMEGWHVFLTQAVRALQRQGMIQEGNVVNMTILKGIEPAYNFFGIQPERVSTKAWTLIGLLVFYVIYTLWYGFAIFDIFDGIGLSMKKSKVRKEV